MSSNYSPSLVTNGLVLCLDSQNQKSYVTRSLNWIDLSNNGNNGTFNNGISYTGGSIFFSGSANTIFSGNSLNRLPDLTGSFSVCCWVNYYSTASYTAYFEKQNSAQSSPTVPRLDMGHIAGTTYFTTYDAAANSEDAGNFGFNMKSSQWYNMVLTCSSGSKSAYVNGVLLYNNTASCSWPDSTQVLAVGGNVRKLNGNVGQVLVYNRKISQDEVMRNYNASKTRYEPSPSPLSISLNTLTASNSCNSLGLQCQVTTGNVIATVTGGRGGYRYFWNDAAANASSSNVTTFTNTVGCQTPFNYTASLFVTDMSGATATATVTIIGTDTYVGTCS